MSSLIAQHAQWIVVVILFFCSGIIGWCGWLTTRVVTCSSHHDVERVQERVLIAVEKIRSEIHREISELRKDMHEHERQVYEWMRNGGKH